MNKYLEHLKEDKLVYYIYQNDLSIYDISSDCPNYIVIANKDYRVPEEFKDSIIDAYKWKPFKFGVIHDGSKFIFYEMQEWFKYVLNCDILAWECSCLNKKFIIKEHVKLMLETDLLKLRKNFDAMLDPYMLYANSKMAVNDFDSAKFKLFEILKTIIFTNQIIENHKIVNYKAVKDSYYKLINCEETQDSVLGTFLELFTPELKILMNKTDEMLTKDKLNNYEKI